MALKTVTESGWVYFSCVVPRPDGIGVEKRAWSHLMAMASLKPPRVVLALTSTQLAQAKNLTFLEQHCQSIHLLPLTASWRGRKVVNTAALIAQRLLLWAQPRLVPEPHVARALGTILNGNNLDEVFCFRLTCFEIWRLLCHREGFKARRLIVDFDDIESISSQRTLAYEQKRLGKIHTLVAKLEIAERRRLETLALNSSEVLVCSTDDATHLIKRSPNACVRVIPNAYPVLDQLPQRCPSDVMHLLFLGTLSYQPNIDAVEYLVRDILPALRKSWQGTIQLCVAGRQPSQRVLALHQPPDIVVEADVQDVKEAYAKSDIVLVPIRSGGGTRIKILEALSLGRPIVSTSIGAEGLDLRDDKDILIANTPAEFAKACVRVARDEAFANNLVNGGRQRFIELYSDDIVCKRLRETLQHLYQPAKS